MADAAKKSPGGKKRLVNLKTALILYVLLPMGALTAAGAWWSLRVFERQVENRMQKDLEMVARAIKRPLSHALLREREGSIAEALESAFAISHVYGAYLYDADGRQVSDTVSHGGEIERQEISERVAEGEEHGRYGEVGGRYVYSYFIPLTDPGGRITGLLQLTRRYSDFEEHIRRIRYRTAGLFILGFLGLTGAVFYGHHRVFGKHLNRLSRSMTKIAEGDHRHRWMPGGPRELFALGGHFNRMMDNIDRARREIRRRRERQESLEERLRQTEKLAAIGELAAGVAHELGSPLSLVDAKTQRLLRRGGLTGKEQRSINDIQREARRMDRIIRQLLDFSRRNKIERWKVRASGLARSALSLVEDEAAREKTRLIDRGGSDPVLDVDPARVEQALANLLRNGVQAAPGGNVRISRRLAGGDIVFSVEDDGPGVDERHLSKLFQPFFTTKPVGKGTGLGLAVVHGIAEEHGGRVEVDRRRRKGACFRLILPMGSIAPDEPEGEREAR